MRLFGRRNLLLLFLLLRDFKGKTASQRIQSQLNGKMLFLSYTFYLDIIVQIEMIVFLEVFVTK